MQLNGGIKVRFKLFGNVFILGLLFTIIISSGCSDSKSQLSQNNPQNSAKGEPDNYIIKVKQVILIRHAEKENQDGSEEQVHLSDIGKKRAGELPEFFMKHRPKAINKPDILMAMKQKKPDESNRAYETIEPLSKMLNIPIISDFKRSKTNSAVNEINSCGEDKTVLVCWEHVELVNIAKSLGAPVKTWGYSGNDFFDQSNNYDAIWVITNNKTIHPDFATYKQFKIFNNGKISYEGIGN
jgi:hypothetical protein